MKICSKCNLLLDDDANFCPVCGGKAVEQVKNPVKEQEGTKKKVCNFCGREIDSDAVFCPFCGSEDIVETDEPVVHLTETENEPPLAPVLTPENKTEEKEKPVTVTKEPENKTEVQIKPENTGRVQERPVIQNPAPVKPVAGAPKQNINPYKIAFIVTLLVAFALCGFCIYSYSSIKKLNNTITNLYGTNVDLKKEVTTEQNKANKIEYKADAFDTILNSSSYASNGNFFVSNTVLRKPINQKVVFYIVYDGTYTISWDAEEGINVVGGNTSEGLVYLDITYTGSGVKTITCTNNINNEQIIIYCVGD